MSGKNSIQVAIKVRPLFRKEKDQQFFWRIVDNSIQLVDSQSEPYYFDHIFDQDATNQIIFDKMAKQIVNSAIQGFNGTIFAYGQTSSGKTYTMMGDDDNPGVMVLAAKEIFKEIERTQDRQFLLRVGYIEIYNEKIYDLLNKKNHDLKIHETSTGIVSVNCEECIIRSEDDLLNHLSRGGKERTVGETNMNERSSRSHAIFRIIIESRKMERSEDDAVIQSVINLVDLAGSERADQTGARGTRLKEGGHINKSLLFLSNVIKRLSENEDDKYISFRDSKLTRILQASLGGNALTAIICTIKPNAVEETQSTLNFALRAKAIKNKPQVNETVSDATMMKRLENEIKVLKSRLEEEQRKNESQIKVRQLEQRIKDEDLKIISCNSLHSIRNREKRRRTWCPSSTNLDASAVSQHPSALPVPAVISHLVSGQPSRLQAPKTSYYNTPLITVRTAEPPSAQKFCGALPKPPDNLPEIDEEFAPAELINFEMLSPLNTPRIQRLQRKDSITPKLTACPSANLAKIEHDLWELQRYTDLENKTDVQHETFLALKQKIETLSQRNAVLENERLEYIQSNHEIVTITDNLNETQKQCDELQVQLSKLTNSNKKANEKIAKYEAELAELKKTNEKLEMENREAVTLEFEFERHKNKSKLRETELLEALNDKDKEVSKLEKSLNALSAERLQNSKEELLQKSLNEDGAADENGKVCIKCEDLQRLLEENRKVTLEFDKLTLEYEKLKLNYVEIERENDTNKLKIIHLEKLQEKEKAECEKLLLDVKQLREKLNNVQRDYAQLNSENSSKHEECMALNRQVEVAREEMVVLEEKFTKLEISWQEQQQTLNEIEAQYANIQTKYEQLQSQYEQLEATRGQSLTDCQRLEKENVDLQTEIEELKKKVQDAQQKLLESNKKYEETAKETKTASKEFTAETTKIHQENELLKKQLLVIQTQFEGLQKEYDDLSNQIMDNLQESETLKHENTKLQAKLKDYEEKNQEVSKAEAEIKNLKSQLERVLSSEKNNQLKTPSPCPNSSMRSSGVCVEDEEDFVDFPDSQDLLRKFCELSESLTEIELEHTKGKTKIFRSASKNSTPNSYKMYIKNIFGVRKTQKEFDMEIENIHLQGSFKHHSFHIVEVSGDNISCELQCDDIIDINGCENMAAYTEKLKQEIQELKNINQQERLSNKSLLESTERAFSEMREQITQLSAELMEKSIFVENCACKTYQQQIENLEKEKADITIIYEELQEKVNCTLNGSFNMPINNTSLGAEIKVVDDDKLKELEQLKLRERELLESYDSQTKTLEEMTQRCVDMETDLEAAQEQLEQQEKEFKEKHNQLQLETLQKLELSVNEYRDNMKKYNKEWEDKKEEYELTIKDLQNEIDLLKKSCEANQHLEKTIKKENNSESRDDERVEESTKEKGEDLEITDNTNKPAKDIEMPEDDEATKQQQLMLEEEKLNLQQLLNTAEVQLESLKEENRTQYEEITLLDAKIISLEEHLADTKLLHTTLSKENSTLENQIKDLEEDLNCIPELHNKNQELSDEVEKLNREYSQVLEKLQKAELQIQEFFKEETNREELIQNLQSKSNQLTVLEEEKRALANEFKNLQQELHQVQEKLEKTEVQIQEFCSEDSSREEIIQTMQSKLAGMSAVEEKSTILEVEKSQLKETLTAMVEENKNLANESTQLKESLKQLQAKDFETSKYIESLKGDIAKLKENLAELQLEKFALEEKLQQITTEHNLLKTDKVLLDTQLSELTEEGKSLNDQCAALQKEKATLEEQLQCIQEKENTEEYIESFKNDIAKLKENLAEVQLEKCGLEEKLQQITTEHNLLKTDKVLLDTQLSELTEEGKSLNDQCAALQKEKATLEEQLKCIQEKENTEEYIESFKNDIAKLKENLAEVQLEKCGLEEKLQQITTEHNLLKTDKVLLDTQLSELTEEGKSLIDQCAALQKEKAALEEQLQCLKEKEKTEELLENIVKEKADLVHNLRLTAQKLECTQTQLEEKENQISHAKEEKAHIKKELESLKESLLKTIEEKHKQLEETKKEKEKTNQDLQALKERFNTTNDEKQKQQTEFKILKEENSKLKEELKKINQEKQEQQLYIKKTKQEHNNLQENLKTLKESLSKAMAEKQQEVNNMDNNYQTVLQKNQELQQTLETCIKEKQQKIKENTQLQTELQASKESLAKLQEELQKLQDKLVHYQKLQEDKNKLEATLNILKSAQTGALSTLQLEKDQLHISLQQYEQQTKQFKQNEETLKDKIDSISQQLHEFRAKAQSYEKLLFEHDEVETALTSATAVNNKLQNEITQLKSQQHNYMTTKSGEIEKLNLQLDKHVDEKQILQTKLSLLEKTIQGEHSSLKREHDELKGAMEELKIKCDSLQTTNTQLQDLNQTLEQQLAEAKKRLNEYSDVQEQLNKLKMQHSELQNSLKETVEEAGRCSLALQKDVEHHKQLLQKQTKSFNSLKTEMETKQQSLFQEIQKLSSNIKTLQNEKHTLEEKLKEITVRNFEQVLQRQAIDATANNSIDSNSSYSPRGRRSLERIGAGADIKIANISVEDKLSAIQQKNSTTTAERKNRRLSTHDERRRQSYWGAAHDKETMTDPMDSSCNCIELDRKLKESERNLFIKNSQVTALNMELKNHPLKEENAALMKRLQEDQDKHRVEIKRYKNKLYEQTAKAEKAIATAAHATAKSAHIAANAALAADQQVNSPVLPKVVADVEIQTDDDLSTSIQKLQDKYNYLKNICRYRYNVIKELEEKVAHKENSDINSVSAIEEAQFKALINQCESLKKELKTVKEKYDIAKKVLYSRREEIVKLRAQLEQTE